MQIAQIGPWFKIHAEYFERLAAEQKQAFKNELSVSERYDAMTLDGVNPSNGLENVTIRKKRKDPKPGYTVVVV